MGLFDFVKDAGESLFGDKEKAPEKHKAKPVEDAVRTQEQALADRAKGDMLTKLVSGMDVGARDVKVKFREGEAVVTGVAESQSARERVVLLVGNTRGVARVDDRMTVEKLEPEAKMHTVQRGDTLSAIAKTYYGDAKKYPVIFEANKPMLKDPDKIYPGQMLRIPPLEG